ncbi:aspartate kinase [[Clostridium] colinum]|uniref:aspartate kinase n=1 Tax=[Clostridium] colinum TaxID=36835 RepID=UPI002024E85C|nr:aspartate kinase [[Clostridium] colinum]
MLIVKKFGGTSVATPERVKNAAKRIVDEYDKGNKVVVVLSAQGDTTDKLIEKAKEINPKYSKREMDMLLATGEQQSVALMAMTIHAMGYPAISLNANQCDICATSNYGNARIESINTNRIQAELDKKNIVIITGFQGINKYGDITTLGRGGSDTSAVALAATLKADLCEIFTDVDGVYTGDPRIIKNAKKLDAISYDEMLELASLGAKVLHNRSVELAKKYNVNLVVRSSLTNEEGTVVKEEAFVEKMIVTGVAVDKNVARISVIGVPDVTGMAFKIFSNLSKFKVSVDIILQSIGRDSTKDISFTVSRDELEPALLALEDLKGKVPFESISYDKSIAKVSIVGAGMDTNSGVASDLFEALFSSAINVNMISTSEIKISVLVDEKDAERSANAIHDKFVK